MILCILAVVVLALLMAFQVFILYILARVIVQDDGWGFFLLLSGWSIGLVVYYGDVPLWRYLPGFILGIVVLGTIKAIRDVRENRRIGK